MILSYSNTHSSSLTRNNMIPRKVLAASATAPRHASSKLTSDCMVTSMLRTIGIRASLGEGPAASTAIHGPEMLIALGRSVPYHGKLRFNPQTLNDGGGGYRPLASRPHHCSLWSDRHSHGLRHPMSVYVTSDHHYGHAAARSFY